MPWVETTLDQLGLPEGLDPFAETWPLRERPCPRTRDGQACPGHMIRTVHGDGVRLECSELPGECGWYILLAKALPGQPPDGIRRWIPISKPVVSAAERKAQLRAEQAAEPDDVETEADPVDPVEARRIKIEKAETPAEPAKPNWRQNPDLNLPPGWGVPRPGERRLRKEPTMRLCELCKGPIRADNHTGVCKKTPACAKESNRRGWYVRQGKWKLGDPPPVSERQARSDAPAPAPGSDAETTHDPGSLAPGEEIPQELKGPPGRAFPPTIIPDSAGGPPTLSALEPLDEDISPGIYIGRFGNHHTIIDSEGKVLRQFQVA